MLAETDNPAGIETTYKVVGKLEGAGVCGGIFEVDDLESPMCVCGKHQRRHFLRMETEKIAVLSLYFRQFPLHHVSKVWFELTSL